MTEIKHQVYSDGTEMWSRDGVLHREDGPAIIRVNGAQGWFQNGQRHRTDGPAMIRSDGTQEWYQHGRLHRTDGPAIYHLNGVRSWYLEGQVLTFRHWLNRVATTPARRTLLLLLWEITHD